MPSEESSSHLPYTGPQGEHYMGHYKVSLLGESSFFILIIIFLLLYGASKLYGASYPFGDYVV